MCERGRQKNVEERERERERDTFCVIMLRFLSFLGKPPL